MVQKDEVGAEQGGSHRTSCWAQVCVMMLLQRGKHPTVWGTEPLGSGDRSELTVLDQGTGDDGCCKEEAGDLNGIVHSLGRQALESSSLGGLEQMFEQKKRTHFQWCRR